ncbi:acyltransferase family protein [Bradyrhizobium sp. TZ2]
MLRERPWTAFGAFLLVSVAVYVPMRLIFGDASWLEPGGYPLPIQTSRILLYAGYFLVGVGIGVVNLRAGILREDGELAKRWPVWLAYALLFYGVILLLVYGRHNWIADFDLPALLWRTFYGLAFALFSAAMAFVVLAVSLRLASTSMRLLDAMRPSVYGIFLTHYIFIIWLQYAVYNYAWPAFVKFAVVFISTLALSWAVTLLLRKIPVVARMI